MLDELKEFGVDIDEGLERLMKNEELYIKLIKMATADSNFSKLEKAINENDLESAFEAAHSLKGVLGNLSIKPIYDKIYEITELLRKKEQIDYSLMLQEIFDLKDKLCEIVNKI